MKEPKRFKGQTAIITGGARGLGLATAKRLAQKGVRTVLFDLQVQELEAARLLLGPNADACVVDVTSPERVGAAVEEVIGRHGRIDILINSAGITGSTNIKSHLVSLEDFDHVFNVNVRAGLIIFQAVLPHMLERSYGRVLHVASIAGKEGNAGMLAYSSSKAAVIGMTKVQGKEYATTGITVNAIAPAVIRTDLVEAMPPEQVRYMTDKIPMSRCGTLDEFAAMAEFVVSPENGFCTGFTFDLSGGRAVY